MKKRTSSLLLGLLFLGSFGCGGSGSGYSDKCRAACDPSSIMVCTTMDPSACQRDCEARTTGLSATCATCITQSNAWKNAIDSRSSGSSTCRGYAFPSITDTSAMGCANACK